MLSGKPVRDEQLAFLVPDVTTRQEVIEKIGSPDVIWEEARVFAYNWEMRQGILIWAVAGGYSATGGYGNIGKRYALLMRFDEQGRLRNFEKVVHSPFKSYGAFLQEWVQQSTDTPAHDQAKPIE